MPNNWWLCIPYAALCAMGLWLLCKMADWEARRTGDTLYGINDEDPW